MQLNPKKPPISPHRWISAQQMLRSRGWARELYYRANVKRLKIRVAMCQITIYGVQQIFYIKLLWDTKTLCYCS